jgi:hypothetical protein
MVRFFTYCNELIPFLEVHITMFLQNLTEAANQNFDAFPKFFVSRDLSIEMLTSFVLYDSSHKQKHLGLMALARSANN